MFGCYRKNEVSDPDIYTSAVAAVLSEYPQAVIDKVTDPRTGLPSDPDSQYGVPNVGAVRSACDQAWRTMQILALPKLKPTAISTAKRYPEPDLFIPEDVAGYAEMVERAKNEDPKLTRFEENHKCLDKRFCKGIWIPRIWSGEKKRASGAFESGGYLGPS